MGTTENSIVSVCEEFVKRHFKEQNYDSSHDWWHIHRVRNLALNIAKQEALPSDSLEVVELAALLHDVGDWKYAKGSETDAKSLVPNFLKQQGFTGEKAEQVLYIVNNLGFKEELSGGVVVTPELAAVQDADRLDAIGAVGVARCLTFGGRFQRVLHDPDVKPRDNLTKEAYMNGAEQQTTINHFYEKLLKLKDKMKTATGRRIAEERHMYMEQFLDRFFGEWEGDV